MVVYQPQECFSNVGFDIDGVRWVKIDDFSGSRPPPVGACCLVKF